MKRTVMTMATMAVALGASAPAMAANWTGKVDVTIGGTDYRRQFPGSCTATFDLLDGNGTRDFMIVAGGYDQAGNAQPDAFRYDPLLNTWTKVQNMTNPANTVAVGEPEVVRVAAGASADKKLCVFMGGKQTIGGVAVTQTLEYDASTNTWTKGGNMPVARVNFKASQCGSAKILAVSGWDNNGTYTTRVDVYTPGVGWGAGALTNLATSRAYFALAAKDNTFQKFVIAGGKNSGGTIENSVELLNVTGTCTLTTLCTPTVPTIGGNTVLATRRWMTEGAVYKTGNEEYLIAAGADSSNVALSSTEKVTVNSWTPGACQATVTGGSALQTAHRRPVLAIDDVNLSKFYFIGGQTTEGWSVNKTQIWVPATPQWQDKAGTANAEDTLLNNGRYGAAAAYLGSATNAFTAVGVRLLSGGALEILKSTEAN